MPKLSYPGQRPAMNLTAASSALKLVVTDTDPPAVSLEPSKADIAKHLHALFDPAFVKSYPEARIEIPFGHPDIRKGAVNDAEVFSVFDLKGAAEFAENKNREGFNIYVCPALQGNRPDEGRASDQHVVTSAVGWSEFDKPGDAERISAVLNQHNLKPYLVVTTGTVPNLRAHLYFRLDGTVTPDQLRAFNEQMKNLLGGDAVQNPSRCMRLAGTINYPQQKKAERGYVPELVTLKVLPDAPAYRFDVLNGLGGSGAEPSGHSGDRTSARTDDEIISLLHLSKRPGEWHNAILRAIATMVGRGWNELQIRLACAAFCEGGHEDFDLTPMIDGAFSKYHNDEAAIDEGETESKAPWPVIDAAALHGLAGEIVRTFEPHTESDPIAILVQVLVAFGNLVGPSPHYLVERDKHRANLFAVLVGASAKGRKGTSAGWVQELAKAADEFWDADRCASGLSSGEGVINAVRDEVGKWDAKEQREEIVDPGVKDKRLFVTEQEFAGALSVMERHGSILSPLIRNAWDGRRLQTLAKAVGQKATGHHISILGHITEPEMRKRLTQTEMANGFANRFLFCCVKRSKMLPHGGHISDADMARLAGRFREAVEHAKGRGRLWMTNDAARVWTAAYPELSAERPGLLGSVVARSEAQAIRLALIYALIDGADRIDVIHLEAAFALWDYCEQSAARIFGDSLGDPMTDEIHKALQRNPGGMTRTNLRDMFQRHASAQEIQASLSALAAVGKARMEKRNTGGRSSETWFFTVRTKREQ